MSKTSEAAQRVELFMQDEAIQGVFKTMKADAYHAFLFSHNDESRRNAHANAMAIDKLEQGIRAIVDAGERERLEEEHAERRLSTR